MDESTNFGDEREDNSEERGKGRGGAEGGEGKESEDGLLAQRLVGDFLVMKGNLLMNAVPI